ncbi:MAG: hypothetical protein JXR25_14015 [Pontiellaceae bacterium]|nr:hypothetical protein [Pontiellaceae bacterium]MBN2785934.1 hypothetical protein [Pontiellaceae bacterium]
MTVKYIILTLMLSITGCVLKPAESNKHYDDNTVLSSGNIYGNESIINPIRGLVESLLNNDFAAFLNVMESRFFEIRNPDEVKNGFDDAVIKFNDQFRDADIDDFIFYVEPAMAGRSLKKNYSVVSYHANNKFIPTRYCIVYLENNSWKVIDYKRQEEAYAEENPQYDCFSSNPRRDQAGQRILCRAEN